MIRIIDKSHIEIQTVQQTIKLGLAEAIIIQEDLTELWKLYGCKVVDDKVELDKLRPK